MARSSGKAYPSEDRYVSPIDRKDGPWDDYDIDNFLRTLTDAQKISKNRKLMARVKAQAQKKLLAAKSIAETLK